MGSNAAVMNLGDVQPVIYYVKSINRMVRQRRIQGEADRDDHPLP